MDVSGATFNLRGRLQASSGVALTRTLGYQLQSSRLTLARRRNPTSIHQGRLTKFTTAVSVGPQEHDTESFPWGFLFQCNERYLQWDDSAQRRLIKLYVAGKLQKDVEWVDARLNEVAVLLPDIVGKLERMKADLVLSYVQDTEGLATKLIALREAMPRVNLSELSARHPSLILELTPEAVVKQMDSLRHALPGVDVEALIQQEPLLLNANITSVLDSIKRLLPASDPVAVLQKDPSLVLDMETSRMPTAEGENLLEV